MIPFFQRLFCSISLIFNLSKHVRITKKWQMRREHDLTNCNHAISDGNVVSTMTFASSQKKQFLGQFQLFLLLVSLLWILTHSTRQLHYNYSSYQRGNKSVFCNGNVFWQIVFRPKAIGTCFGNDSALYKFETNENATGTHLQKRIFLTLKGLLWP